MTAKTIVDEALKLSEAERSGVVCELLDSLHLKNEDTEKDDLHITPEFAAELDRISNEIDAHPERLVPLTEAQRKIESELGI